jgi:hypothetical protein
MTLYEIINLKFMRMKQHERSHRFFSRRRVQNRIACYCLAAQGPNKESVIGRAKGTEFESGAMIIVT